MVTAQLLGEAGRSVVATWAPESASPGLEAGAASSSLGDFNAVISTFWFSVAASVKWG